MVLEEAPVYPEFRKVTIEDRSWISSFFEAYPTTINERTFGSLFVWRGYEDRSSVSSLDGHLLVSWRRERFGKVMLPPTGPDPAGVVMGLERSGFPASVQFSGVLGVAEPLASDLRNRGLTPESLRDEWDYVYLRDDLANLEGSAYHTQRKEMGKATSALKLEYHPMSPAWRESCLSLEESWCDLKHCTMDRFSKAEDAALKEALLNFGALGFLGGVVVVEGKVEALTVGEKLDAETAVVHFEKANPEIRGLYQVINQRFSEQGLRGFKFVNREQDLGEPGLRRAKEGYHPHHFVEKHFVRFHH